MSRGDLAPIAGRGAYGKPRPALIVQSDFFAAHTSILVLPLTTDVRNAPLLRIDWPVDATTNLRRPSQVMVDKAQAVPTEKVGDPFGHVDAATMRDVEGALLVLLGLA